MQRLEPTQTLGDRARLWHLRFGVVNAGIALAFGLLLVETGIARQFGWLIALPLAFATYGLFAGALGVCLYTGMRGERAADHGPEAVLDQGCARSIKARAGVLLLTSVAVASLGAAGFVASL